MTRSNATRSDTDPTPEHGRPETGRRADGACTTASSREDGPTPAGETPLVVAVDARALTKPAPTGVVRYTRELLRGADAADLPVEYVLYGTDGVPDSLSDCESVRSADVPAPAPAGPRAHLWEQGRLPLALRNADADLLHVPAGLPPLLSPIPVFTTVHDLSPLDHPEWFTRSYAALYRVGTPLAVRRSTRLLAVSRTTRRRLVERYPGAADRTVAVHSGVRPPPGGRSTLDPLENPGDGFLLFVGAPSPRKNLRRALSAYRLYRRRTANPPAFLLVGPEKDTFADPELPHVDGVRSLGFVSDETLGGLYRRAGALVYPSLYEGFGLPILEAMSVGTPVVTSDRGATAEVAGDAAVLVDPLSVREIADGLERVLDPSVNTDLVESGRDRAAAFSWERTARQTVAVYRSVAGGGDTETGDDALAHRPG
jgi:glycosyltransferase involved in cell wall biosynthesis